ncbi:MAG: hypothetical protein RMJ66_07380 [Bacteroidia bacterium]|nr:hypothetical protein [Bacteroidia bacterium]MDW8134875.1 hypothetical protein [Bacteroidia bacterium]
MFSRGVRILLASFKGLLSLRAQVWDSSLALPGCESLAQDGEYIWVFSYDRRVAIEDTSVKGHLFRFKANADMPFIMEVTPPSIPWYPFGLAYQRPHLWFLNGTRERASEVWRYTWNGQTLIEPKVWRSNQFVSLQGVYPIGTEAFYVINDRSHSRRWHLVLGFFIRRVRSNVLFCEADTCYKVADKIPYASGLAYSSSQQRLFISVAFRKAIWVYQEIGETPKRLRHIRRIRLPGYPDNITPLSDSLFWVVCHRHLGRWARSLAFGSRKGQWSIIEVKIASSDQIQIRNIYTTRRGYSTASMATPIGGYIYVGSIFEPYLLRLRVKDTTLTDLLPSNTGDFLAPPPAGDRPEK